nr:MAG TPA: hypothetical protein [Caudoviricetes sp.]
MSALNWTFFAGTPTIRDRWEAKYGESAWGYRVSAKIEAWRDKRNKRKTIYALRLQASTIDAPYFFEDFHTASNLEDVMKIADAVVVRLKLQGRI